MHAIQRLYSAEFDYELARRRPNKEYMVASSPRAGSTFLCIELWKTGLLGAPMEYANLGTMKTLLRRIYQFDDLDRYWSAVTNLRTSPNGVFGYKMFMNFYKRIADDEPALLGRFRPRSVVYLTRRDSVGQAISHSRAVRSNIWFSGTEQPSAIDYEYAHIRKCEIFLQRQEQFWRDLFSEIGVQPLEVAYEDLQADPPNVVQKVAEYLNIDLSKESQLELPQLEIQRDTISQRWRERYLEDRQQKVSNASSSLIANLPDVFPLCE